MRITGGRARGIQLEVPKGDKLRPATDRMREAIFSRLGGEVVDASFLDLFAGCGSYGLEAISRGAATGSFVEKHAAALRYLKQNLLKVVKSCGVEPLAFALQTGDALGFRPTAPVDLIFADPPYADSASMLPSLLDQLDRCLKPGGRVILELPSELGVDDPRWQCERRWGKEGRGNPAAHLLIRT